MALTVDAETEYERDITSELIGWAIVVLMAGYIIVALVVLAAKWAHRSKVGARIGRKRKQPDNMCQCEVDGNATAGYCQWYCLH